jgi:hypothetical protein
MNDVKRGTPYPINISVTVLGYKWKVEISIKNVFTKEEMNGSLRLVIEDG